MKTFERLFWTSWCSVAAFGLVYFGRRGTGVALGLIGSGKAAGILIGSAMILFAILIGLLVAVQGFVFLVKLWQPEFPTPKAAPTDPALDPYAEALLLQATSHGPPELPVPTPLQAAEASPRSIPSRDNAADPEPTAWLDLNTGAESPTMMEVLLRGGPYDGRTVRTPASGNWISFDAPEVESVIKGAQTLHNYRVADPVEWTGGIRVFAYTGTSPVFVNRSIG